MKKILLLFLSRCLASGILFIFPFPAAISKGAEKNLPFGALLCLSGRCAEWGTEAARGARLAVKEINQEGGVLGRQIDLIIEDSKEDNIPDSISAFRRLATNQKINYILGPSWTPAGLAIAPIAKNLPALVTSPSLGVREFNETSDNLFNLWPHDENSSRLLARYAVKKGWKRIAIFGTQQPWTEAQGNFFREELLSLGGVVTELLSPSPSNKDLTSEALRIVSSKPDAVLLSCFSDQTIIALQRLHELRYHEPILSILMDETLLHSGKALLEGLIFTRHREPNENFQRSYKKEFHAWPGVSADTAYDAIRLYAYAIEKAQSTDPSIVKRIMHHITDWEGVSGRITFDGQRGILRDPLLYTVHNETMIPLLNK